jgi:hypothetical protein
MDIEILKQKRQEALNRSLKYHTEIEALRPIWNNLNDSHAQAKAEYMALDRKLAMIDGRYKILPPKKLSDPTKRIKISSEKSLSMTQVKEFIDSADPNELNRLLTILRTMDITN